MTEPAILETANPHEALVLRIDSVSGVQSIFMKLRDVFPDCAFLIQDTPQWFPLRCLQTDGCPRNQNCMGRLLKRVQYVFDTFEQAQLLCLYFSYPDRPGSQRAGVFWRDLREPRYITFNRTAWEKMKKVGMVYTWRLPDSLFLG